MTLLRAARYGVTAFCLLLMAVFSASADTFFSDFSSLPPGTRIIDPSPTDGVAPRVEGGVLKLASAENLGTGGVGGFGIGPFPQTTISGLAASWKSLIGAGGGGG